ncbi:MAG TPA: hypothetical protein VH761_16785 [Ilumatobacteraceae bacterium]
MRAPELLAGWRVVARPEAIDALVAPPGGAVLRIAPDDAIVSGIAGIDVDDPHAIVEPEYAFVHWKLAPSEFAEVERHIEWPLPRRGQLGQGLIAGVPAKIAIEDDHVVLVVSASLAHELMERLW